MRKLMTATLLAIGLAGSVAYAAPNPAELEANFYKCIQHDESWYRRWGYWVASFNQKEAWKICRYYGGDIRMTGCYINHKWHKAGYYCVYE